MTRCLSIFTICSIAAFAQGLRNPGFEEGDPGTLGPGWFGPRSINGYTVSRTASSPRSGTFCAEIAWTGAQDPKVFGNVMQSFDATPYRGKKVRFRAAVKLGAAAPGDHAQLWMRVDRTDKSMGFFDNMNDRPITAASWTEFEINGELDETADRINIGLMLFGKGKAWLDDVTFEVTGETPTQPPYTPSAGAAFDRLTEASKLWVYVKYFHPRVTAPGVDWDQAFMDAAPAILESKNDDEYAAALGRMLEPLHDPSTRVVNPRKEFDNGNQFDFDPAATDVLVVGKKHGSSQESRTAHDALRAKLATVKAAVFDLRGQSGFAQYEGLLAGADDVAFPAQRKRVHDGYASQNSGGYQGYHSSWVIEEGAIFKKTDGAHVPTVFLVNRQTMIPQLAVALQTSGDAAIVSEGGAEDAPNDAQFVTGHFYQMAAFGVIVRTSDNVYPDGTTGLSPNVILNQTGDQALQAAIDIARSGKWPQPLPRRKPARIPAVYTERTYGARDYPSTQLRMLAAARIWGVFNYFHPYKDLYGEDWDAVLADFLPRMAAAKDAREYNLEVARMVAHTHDTHCYVSSAALNAARGNAPAGLTVRWIEHQPVVTKVVDDTLHDKVHPGDVVTKIDGEPVARRIDWLSPTIAASTPQSLMARVMEMLLSGNYGVRTTVGFRGPDAVEHDVEVGHDPAFFSKLAPSRNGETFRLLNPKVGYVDLERLPNAQVDAMFDAFQNTEAIIMDMRGYPQGTAWSIAPRLAVKPALLNAQIRTNVVSAYGENAIRSELGGQRIPVADKPRYTGKTIMLIDERAISQSEHSGLMYKTANGTVFIGSGTTGANGDITGFTAPGGIRIPFSGHDIRWPDGKQLQRVGLVPDIEVHPTIAGIRDGRDEVLERALQYLKEGK